LGKCTPRKGSKRIEKVEKLETWKKSRGNIIYTILEPLFSMNIFWGLQLSTVFSAVKTTILKMVKTPRIPFF
jgi:hypothetical protein